MLEMSSETVNVGHSTFVINESIIPYGDMIVSHTFRIGGSYDDCIGVSYTYKGKTPESAKIMTVDYEPECSIGKRLEKGGGTAIMLKTLLQYVHNKIPSITVFTFEDMSHIDCAEPDLSKPPPRKLSKPLSLAYLSIAYNSCTWYEKHFDARMSDERRYSEYRRSLEFLTEPSSKVDFISFLQIAKPPKEQYSYLEPIYTAAETYRDFFKAIPFKDRCEILRPWLGGFIDHYIHKFYSPFNWQIDITSSKIVGGGGKKKTLKRRTMHSDFPSNYKIITYKDVHSF